MAELDQLDPGRQGRDRGRHPEGQGQPDQAQGQRRGEWGGQVTKLDDAVNAFQATISGISGDSLLSDLPDRQRPERIDTAWNALDQQIRTTCG